MTFQSFKVIREISSFLQIKTYVNINKEQCLQPKLAKSNVLYHSCYVASLHVDGGCNSEFKNVQKLRAVVPNNQLMLALIEMTTTTKRKNVEDIRLA